MLFNGMNLGCASEVMASHATATPTQQKIILEAMRVDWQRHGERLLGEGGRARCAGPRTAGA
jgi:hypothetical protein